MYFSHLYSYFVKNDEISCQNRFNVLNTKQEVKCDRHSDYITEMWYCFLCLKMRVLTECKIGAESVKMVLHASILFPNMSSFSTFFYVVY